MKMVALMAWQLFAIHLVACTAITETGSAETTDANTYAAECPPPPVCQYAAYAPSGCTTAAMVDGAECALQNGDAGYCLAGVCSVCTSCDDGNECTLDACTATGCAHYPYAAQRACTAGHCVINSFVSPDAALCVADGMCLDLDPITKIVAPVKVCSGGQKCGVYSGMCGSI